MYMLYRMCVYRQIMYVHYCHGSLTHFKRIYCFYQELWSMFARISGTVHKSMFAHKKHISIALRLQPSPLRSW